MNLPSNEYLERAEFLLEQVERLADTIADEDLADMDCQRVGSMLTWVFASGQHVVINLQKPLQEVWMATPTHGLHYQWKQGKWRNTRRESTFWDDLAETFLSISGACLPAPA